MYKMFQDRVLVRIVKENQADAPITRIKENSKSRVHIKTSCCDSRVGVSCLLIRRLDSSVHRLYVSRI